MVLLRFEGISGSANDSRGMEGVQTGFYCFDIVFGEWS